MAHEKKDPKEAGYKPPFPQGEQQTPGSEKDMDPPPDYGEKSYVGHDRLRGRCAVITGGDSGIGRAVALAFAREGASVAISCLEEELHDAEETVRVCKAGGAKVWLKPGDLKDDSHCKQFIDGAADKLGAIDILVNNAAYQGKSVETFEEISIERVKATFQTNIVAMFSLVHHALRHMRKGAAIINVGSIQAYQPSPGILDYASTKGAIVAFTKGLSQTLIERGIRVNCVAPGPVWTPLIAQSFKENKVRNFGKNAPMKRPAQPVELAPAFVFLACDDARYINGEVLGVTGGEILA